MVLQTFPGNPDETWEESMKRLFLLIVFVIAAAVLASPAAALANAFAQGVASGDVTSTSAILWTRVGQRGPGQGRGLGQPRTDRKEGVPAEHAVDLGRK